jgi:ribonuclease HI
MSSIHVSFDGGVRGSHKAGRHVGSYGVVVRSVVGSPTFPTESCPFGFGQVMKEATNNIAEYAGCVAALKVALYADVDEVVITADSKLVVMQVLGQWKCNHAHLREYRDVAGRIMTKFRTLPKLQHVPRAQNAQADSMCNGAMDQRSMVTMGPSPIARAAAAAASRSLEELTAPKPPQPVAPKVAKVVPKVQKEAQRVVPKVQEAPNVIPMVQEAPRVVPKVKEAPKVAVVAAPPPPSPIRQFIDVGDDDDEDDDDADDDDDDDDALDDADFIGAALEVEKVVGSPRKGVVLLMDDDDDDDQEEDDDVEIVMPRKRLKR